MPEDMEVLSLKLAICSMIDEVRQQVELLPRSREQALTVTKLDEAGMWALRISTEEAV
jgi:hypothetical protein